VILIVIVIIMIIIIIIFIFNDILYDNIKLNLLKKYDFYSFHLICGLEFVLTFLVRPQG